LLVVAFLKISGKKKNSFCESDFQLGSYIHNVKNQFNEAKFFCDPTSKTPRKTTLRLREITGCMGNGSLAGLYNAFTLTPGSYDSPPNSYVGWQDLEQTVRA
jgi:hypothetical protein